MLRAGLLRLSTSTRRSKCRLHSIQALVRRKINLRVCGAGVSKVNGLFLPSGKNQFASGGGFLMQLKKGRVSDSGSKPKWTISSDYEILYASDEVKGDEPPASGWYEVAGVCPPVVFNEANNGEMLRQVFGQTPSGESVELFLLETKGMEAEIMSYGATVRALRVCNKEHKLQDVVAGFDSLEDYVTKSPYFGCVVGRFANRIAKGQFSLQQPEGEEKYALAINNGPNALHGGLKGFDKVVWKPEVRSPTQLAFTYTSEDGEEGYPCRVAFEVLYSVLSTADGPTLAVDYTATNEETDGRKTIVNLTNHSYFNLGGDFGDYGIVEHVLHTPNTTRITAIDASSIPTGELRPVKDTVFDFSSKPAAISKERLTDESDDQIKNGNGFDHNFIVDPNVEESSKSLVECARVRSPESGIEMRCVSDEPGVQLYSGNFLECELRGKGHVYGTRGSFCLETQHWPDSVNWPEFPSTELSADKAYASSTHYCFSVAHSSQLVLDGHSLTTSALLGAKRITVAKENYNRMEASSKQIAELRKLRTIYGVNTACGSLAHHSLAEAELEPFQKNLIRSMTANVGDYFSDALVRAAMITCINCLVRGFSGIGAQKVDKLVAMVNAGIFPLIPQKGGDLGPFAYIALAACGEWKVRVKGVEMESLKALESAGIGPMRLKPKDGQSLINGTCVASALSSLVVESALVTALSADAIAALSFEALKARGDSFDEDLHRLKFHPGQSAVARNIRTLTQGSSLLLCDQSTSHALAVETQAEDNGTLSLASADPYSLRCHAQYLGPGRERLAAAGACVERELNSSNDNLQFLHEEKHVWHSGHFHGQSIAAAMDDVKIQLQPIGIVSDRRIDRFFNSVRSRGLPTEMLCASVAGLRMGSRAGQLLTASLVAENRTMATPVSIQSIETTAGFQDVVPFALMASRQALEVVRNLNKILAFEALCAARGAELRADVQFGKGTDVRSVLGSGTLALYDAIREVVPREAEDEREDYTLTPALCALDAAIENATLLDAVTAAVESQGGLHLVDEVPAAHSWAPPIPPTRWLQPRH